MRDIRLKINSLREVSGAMLGLSGKTKHFRLESLPYRSTLSDASKRRDCSVFEQIYYSLLREYKSAATSDHVLLNKLDPSPDKIYVFDKGYNDYQLFIMQKK